MQEVQCLPSDLIAVAVADFVTELLMSEIEELTTPIFLESTIDFENSRQKTLVSVSSFNI